MPRNAKRTPALPATSPGQAYGVAGEQKAAMAQVPLPESAATPGLPSAPPQGGGPGGPPGGALPAAMPDSGGPMPEQGLQTGTPMDSIAAALSMPAPEGDLFDEPTTRPDEPLMTLPIEQAPRVSPTAEILNSVAEAFGNDPDIMAAAAAAQRKGI